MVDTVEMLQRPLLDVRVGSQIFSQLECIRGLVVGAEGIRYACTRYVHFQVFPETGFRKFLHQIT